jgi:hypothetical protein
MWLVDERSGVQSGYYAKLLYSETPSGRLAGWEVLQWVIDALWPDGAHFVVAPVPGDEILRERIATASKRYRKRDRVQRRIKAHLREYASVKEAA